MSKRKEITKSRNNKHHLFTYDQNSMYIIFLKKNRQYNSQNKLNQLTCNSPENKLNLSVLVMNNKQTERGKVKITFILIENN